MKKQVEPAIVELIDSVIPNKIYHMRAPDNTSGEFIIIQRTNSERWRSINAPSGMVQAEIQIDAYAATITRARAIGAEIETILDGYMGVVSYGNDDPQISVDIAGISLQNEFDTFDQTDTPMLYRNLANYLVTYKQ